MEKYKIGINICVHCGVVFDIAHTWGRCPICKELAQDDDRIDYLIEVEL